MKIRFMATKKEYEVTKTGVLTRTMDVAELTSGEVGYISAAIKTIADTRS